MSEVGEINKRGQKLLAKTDKPGNLKNAHLWIVQCVRCSHIYGVNGEDFWQRRCPLCDSGADGLPLPQVRQVNTRSDLLCVIAKLPANITVLRRSYKLGWLRWLSNYKDPSRVTPDRNPEFIYNALNAAEWIVWLAAASGVDQKLVQTAASAIDRQQFRQTQAAAVRRILSWVLISKQLENPDVENALSYDDIVPDLDADLSQ